VEHRTDDLAIPRPAAPNNLYVEVAHSLRALIVDRRMRPGDRLPSERVLAQQLQVGRPVVRDALRILETLGLIGVSPRQGSYIRQPDMAACMGAVVDSVARSLSAEPDWEAGLWEARRILEAEGAALAAQRATPEDRRAVQEAVARLSEGLADPAAFGAAEQEFARAVGLAARNSIVAGLTGGLAGICRNGTAASSAQDDAGRRTALRHYEAVAAAICAGHGAAAREAAAKDLERGGNGHAAAA
jgi:GntR family transcriptional regulator, transcriptional repressor for pyruvate dehydrogenase complex